MRGFLQVAAKEILHLRRDPTTLVIALMIPAIQLTLFGYAIDFDIRHIPTAVVDMDRSRESREYLDMLRATQYIEITRYMNSPDEAKDALRRGWIRVAVIIPPDFSRRGASPKVLIDGSDNQVATRARLAFLSTMARPQSGGNPTSQSPEPRMDMVFNPDMKTSLFMIPGLIGVILQLVTVSLTSFSLVREREHGTLEQLMVSPVGRLGLMLGKLAPYSGLAMIEMATVLLVGWITFDIRPAGSLTLLVLLSVPFVVAALALGLLISTIAQNQAQALQFTLLITLPSILLSGFVFPRETMPGALYLLTFALPVTWFMDILRGIIVRGAGFADLWQNAMALLIITTALLAIA